MTEIRTLRQARDDAAIREVIKALQYYLNVSRAAMKLRVHKNTVRYYMKKGGITIGVMQEWRELRLRQKQAIFKKPSN